MPFINIPESKLPASIASQVGKLQGLLSSKVTDTTNKIINDLSSNDSLPLDKLNKLTNVQNRLTKSIGKVSKRLDRIRRLPNRLRGPVSGLKSAINVIKSLPIPQAVPPGVGLPINITTKYSDLLITLKESVKQIDENITAINSILEVPTKELLKLQKRISGLNIGLVLGKAETKLGSLLEGGEVNNEILVKAGLADSDGFLEFAKLRPNFIKNMDDENFENISNKVDLLNRKLQASPDIAESIKKDFEKLLVFIPFEEKNNRENQAKYFHKGLILSIEEDPNSPSIAKRHYAVAKNTRGEVKFKGPSSFSSDIDVLLDELKFKIDNQLP